MTYEEILQYISGLSGSPIPYEDMNVFNPNETTPTAMMRAPGNINWGAVPGFEQFYSYDQANNQERIDPRVADYAREQGYTMMRGDDRGGQAIAEWLRGPDGQDIAQSARITGTNDDNFKLAALAAMGITGANVLGAMGGAPAASGGGGAEGLYAAGGDMGVGGYTAGGGIGTLPGASSLPAITSGGVPAISNAGLGAMTLPALESIGGGGLFSGLLSGGVGNLLKAGTIAAGAIGGSKPSDGKTTTEQSKTDPRMDPYIYGDDGVLKAYQDFYKKHKTPNANQQAGWDLKLGLLNNPATMQGLQGLMTNAQGLLGSPVAGNGWNKFYGGG